MLVIEMNPVRALILYVSIIFVGGALLAPWLYRAAQWAAEFSPLFQSLAEKPFHRYVSRSLLVLAIGGLWPFLRLIGIRTWNHAGIKRAEFGWKHLRLGMLLGFASLALIVFIALVWNARTLNTQHTQARILGHLFNASLAAVVVSILEEILFRGAIFGSLRKAISWQTALFVSSFIYAIVHFLGRPEPVDSIEWTSGFIALGAMVQNFTEIGKLMPGLVNLTLAGAILGWAYQRTGTLHLSIGLHAGWIFWLKSYGFLFSENAPTQRWFWGTNKLIDGWLATLILLTLLGYLVRRSFRTKDKPGEATSKPD